MYGFPGSNHVATFTGERTQGGKTVKLRLAGVRVYVYQSTLTPGVQNDASRFKYTVVWDPDVVYPNSGKTPIREGDMIALAELQEGKSYALLSVPLPDRGAFGAAVGYFYPVEA